MRILTGRDNTVTTLAFAPDGVLLAATGMLSGVHVWNTHSGELVAVFDVPNTGYAANQIMFTKPHELLVFGSSSYNLCDTRMKRYTRFWFAEFRQTYADAWQALRADEKNLTQVKKFIHDHGDVWNTSIGRVLQYAFDDAERWIIIVTRPAVFVCDRTQPQTPPRKLERLGERDFTMCALHPEGTQLATLAGEKQVRLWDPRTLELQATMAWDVGTLHAVAYSPDGLRAAVGTGNGKVLLWDVE